MRLILSFCRACGSNLVAVHAKERKDVHGHLIQYSEWATCEECGITEMVTPWKEHLCPSMEKHPSTARPN